jgi:hypothetical protein
MKPLTMGPQAAPNASFLRKLPRLPLAILAIPLVAAGLAAACGDSDPGSTQATGDAKSGGNGGGSGDGGNGSGAGSQSTGNSTSSSNPTSSTSGSGSSGSGGSQVVCNQQDNEPNDSAQQAHDIGDFTDADGDTDGITMMGELAGANDEDWYSYHGEDVSLSVVDPARTFGSSQSARMCKFAHCDDNIPGDVTCNDGAMPTSANGDPGCCSNSDFSMDLDCDSGDDNATIYIRIDNPQGHDCVHYQFTFHY